MPGIQLPPFPDDISTHPLLIVDYELIKASDAQEIDKLWKAATGLGFWYLKNHGTDREVDNMFEMGEETMKLPQDERLKFYHKGIKSPGSFGYKTAGEYMTDQDGTPDTIDYISIAKDDALAYPGVIHRTYPVTVNAHMESTIIPFVRKSFEINNTILSVFEEKLGIVGGALLKCHSAEDLSGSDARCIRAPAEPNREFGKDKVALSAHTDLGSLSFLHNRLGGLQVLPPGSTGWQYVRPIPGHAICNIGDTLTILTGGILHSNMHRVIPPPGAQGAYTRWSVVYFTRPGKDVRLRALAEESAMIKDNIGRMSPKDRAKYDPNTTAGEWSARRIKFLSTKNRTGPESWHASRGMEYRPDAV
ncbi:hypothetical protein EW145_g6394 [Phellinidium pouzarii]|uniref:Fe2OG dioxygenase domain-containing protein n=1 Tax=Phellinidium pouzarii TaxID=167371 RepID=A0A4S4KWP4_9AGAM|nr:hypothetical protein EW145_g6394 [Phellinidium pouzarii]